MFRPEEDWQFRYTNELNSVNYACTIDELSSIAKTLSAWSSTATWPDHSWFKISVVQTQNLIFPRTGSEYLDIRLLAIVLTFDYYTMQKVLMKLLWHDGSMDSFRWTNLLFLAILLRSNEMSSETNWTTEGEHTVYLTQSSSECIV
jgi:hypothetical protein